METTIKYQHIYNFLTNEQHYYTKPKVQKNVRKRSRDTMKQPSARSFLLLVLTVHSAKVCDGLSFWEMLFGPSLGNLERRNLNMNCQRDTEQIVKNYGYRLDTHLVAAETGHILGLHRIARGRRYLDSRKPKPVAFICHGMFGSSDMWLLRGPGRDLPYILADSGYDVWLFNSRGNFHSRKHKTLDPDIDKEYWDFGVEEMGYYDLPATIDYILNITNQKDLFFFGHSVGSSIGFISCILRPEYNQKIRLFLALGPLANVRHKLNSLHRFTFLMMSSLSLVVQAEKIYEIWPKKNYFSEIVRIAGQDGSPAQSGCLALIFAVVGEDWQRFNKTALPLFAQYYPAGTSLKVTKNILQYYLSGNFARYNFGNAMENQLYYNSDRPPLYNLSRVTVPVSLYYGEGDALVTKEDVHDLAARLPNVVERFKIPYKNFNHLDFVWAINNSHLLYDHLLHVMDKYR